MESILNIEKTKQRISEIDEEIQELSSKRKDLFEKWQAEKNYIAAINQLKVQIEQAKTDAEKLEREGNLAKVAEIRYGLIHSLENQIKLQTAELNNIQISGKLLKEEISPEDIAEVLSKHTGIPVSKLLQTERMKLLSIENKLSQRVIGQPEAVSSVANAIRRSRAGLQDINKPIGTFIFLGSTGVGKTELAKALAEFLFDDENAIVRIDMSEYMEKFSVSKLIGSPPGYVGYDEGGQLTETIRRRPYSVVLLDEIEKANFDVFNILLQVLDDGRLTDGKGRTVDFKNTIIIMTSNLGTEIINQKIQDLAGGIDQAAMNEIKDEMNVLLKKTLRPEFINRIDEVIVFNPLTKQEIISIAKLQLAKLEQNLNKMEINLEISGAALEFIVRKGYDINFGARPLKRTIQKFITDKVSMLILANELKEGDTLLIHTSDNGELSFTVNGIEEERHLSLYESKES